MKYFAFLFLLLGLPLLALAQSDFVPLTNIPAIKEVGDAITTPEGLSIFLNNIYRLAIGIAAVVAVLQIMRAGIMYMGGDSVTEKKEAKNLIAMSIGGLILVLSPVVVFSIINPEILSLKIGGIEQLNATSTRTAGTGDGGNGGPEGPTAPPPTLPGGEVHGTCQRYANGQTIPANDSTGEQCCGIQSNQYVQCSVNWNYRSEPYVKFCGCQFRGSLASPIRYQVWRLRTEEGGMTEPRMMPKYRTAVEQYEKLCRDNGGAVEDKFLGFLERSVPCDEDSGLATPEEGDSYICQNKEMSCK